MQEKEEMETKDGEEKQEMEEEKIKGALKKMKNKKAVDTDGIPMKAWKYAEDTEIYGRT